MAAKFEILRKSVQNYANLTSHCASQILSEQPDECSEQLQSTEGRTKVLKNAVFGERGGMAAKISISTNLVNLNQPNESQVEVPIPNPEGNLGTLSHSANQDDISDGQAWGITSHRLDVNPISLTGTRAEHTKVGNVRVRSPDASSKGTVCLSWTKYFCKPP